MKTIEALYQEILENDALKTAFAAAAAGDRIGDFLKENGCDATAAQLQAFFEEQQGKNDGLSDDAAGGIRPGSQTPCQPTLVSVHVPGSTSYNYAGCSNLV